MHTQTSIQDSADPDSSHTSDAAYAAHSASAAASDAVVDAAQRACTRPRTGS